MIEVWFSDEVKSLRIYIFLLESFQWPCMPRIYLSSLHGALSPLKRLASSK